MAWKDLQAHVQTARCPFYYDADACDGPDGCEECQRLIAAAIATELGVTLDARGEPYDPAPNA